METSVLLKQIMEETDAATRQEQANATQRKIGFIVLEITFFALVYAISLHQGIVLPQWLIFALFPFATFRAARSISFNEIGEVLRAPFTVVKQDSCGAGANVHPVDGGFRYVIGSLLACPICSGTWSALALYGLWVFMPMMGQTALAVFGFAGASELLHWLGEKLEWEGRQARVVSGKISPDEE